MMRDLKKVLRIKVACWIADSLIASSLRSLVDLFLFVYLIYRILTSSVFVITFFVFYISSHVLSSPATIWILIVFLNWISILMTFVLQWLENVCFLFFFVIKSFVSSIVYLFLCIFSFKLLTFNFIFSVFYISALSKRNRIKL